MNVKTIANSVAPSQSKSTIHLRNSGCHSLSIVVTIVGVHKLIAFDEKSPSNTTQSQAETAIPLQHQQFL